MLRLGALSVLVALLFAVGPAAAQQATPEPHEPYPGEVAYASRTFDASGVRLIGIARLAFTAVEFESDAVAQKGMTASYERWLASTGEDGNAVTMQQASAPALGDESVARAGTISTGDGFDLSVALLQVRIGSVVLGMVGGGLAADALPELVRIAEDVIDRADSPDALESWLPVLSDMPTGFVVYSETHSAA